MLIQARRLTDDRRLTGLRAIANELRGNRYVRKRHLDAEVLSCDLDEMAELVELLAPLARPT